MESLAAELQEVFREVFGDETLSLRDEMTADDVLGWDSLMHLNLIIATEKRFGVQFATAEISSLRAEGQTVGSLLALLRRKAKVVR